MQSSLNALAIVFIHHTRRVERTQWTHSFTFSDSNVATRLPTKQRWKRAQKREQQSEANYESAIFRTVAAFRKRSSVCSYVLLVVLRFESFSFKLRLK